MLPEDEQRQLQEIEQALCRDDPKFGRLMRACDPRLHYERKLIQALLGVVIGVGLLLAGAVTHRVYREAAGVVIVLLSLVWAVVSGGTWPGSGPRVPGRGPRRRRHEAPARAARRARMMARMEERWRRRQEGDGGMPGRSRSRYPQPVE